MHLLYIFQQVRLLYKWIFFVRHPLGMSVGGHACNLPTSEIWNILYWTITNKSRFKLKMAEITLNALLWSCCCTGTEDLGGLWWQRLFTSDLHQASPGPPYCVLGSHSEEQPPSEDTSGSYLLGQIYSSVHDSSVIGIWSLI